MKFLPFGAKKNKDSAAAPDPVKPSLNAEELTDKGRFKFLLGLMMIIASFVGVVVIFYFLFNAGLKKEGTIEMLSQQLNSVNDEKKIVEMELDRLRNKEGEIELTELLSKADKYYSPQEKVRTQGLLWIDQENDSYIVTLGALNGLQPGSRLQVYDGNRRIGEVTVGTPMDIISYVQIPQDFQGDLEKGPYKVVIE